MNGLSVLIITRNEEHNIGDCLASAAWADEIVVVDAESDDETRAIAAEYTPKVFTRRWEGYSAAKNYGLSHCTCEWVLWLDADERITPELAAEMRQAMQQPEIAGYEIPRRAFFLGRWMHYSGWYPGYVLRLFRRNNARFNDMAVHEGVILQGKTSRLRHDLLHYTDRTIEHYFDKLNRYTTLAAAQLAANGRRFRFIDLLLRPAHTFIKMYLLKRGFLDGLQGLMLAVFSACYVFTKYAKLWHLGQQTDVATNRTANLTAHQPDRRQASRIKKQKVK